MAGIANPLTSFTDFISSFGGGSSSSGIFGLSDSTLSTLGGLAGLALSPSGLGLGGSFFGGSNQPVGYQGKIPDYRVVRNPVQNSYDTDRRPGSRGRRYFTDTRFVDMDADNQEMGGASNRLSQARQFAAEEAEGIRRAQNTIMAPTEGVASVAPVSASVVAAAPASGVVTLNPVPTYTMESEFPAPVEETKTMAAGGAISAQEQARKDAEALGMTIDEYYALPFKERLGLAAKDIKELADPSLGDARNLGILSLPKPSAPAPEITQETLPKAPVPQPTTTANRPESLTLEDQMGINQGRMTTYPTGAGIGPEMRNEDFMSQLELINQGRPPAPKDTTIPPATYQGRGVPPKPPKPELGDFKGSLDKDNAFRKRQKERREWDKKYGDMYNDDGTLKLDNEGILEQLLQILGAGLGRGLVDRGARGLAAGGMLDGATDGMADKVPAMIDGKDPAALSDGEYVITADVVGHLGNGNSDAGAKVLDDFMGDVRMARTNTRKQAPEINPQKFLPKV